MNNDTPKPPKRFRDMTPAEREAATSQYDAEMIDVESQTRPLSPESAARHERARRKNPGGRPVVGKGAVVISLSVERGLLEQADAYAQVAGVSRSELVATGLRLLMNRKVKPASGE
ncbi:MAG: hypothetical protein ACAI43_03125 [Phycisphaerae bacterium]|nr:hypothetical protein [Tepidisphaeraceae bacterium]